MEAVLDAQSSSPGSAWRGFGAHELTASPSAVHVATDAVAAPVGGVAAAADTRFCSTRRCKALVGVSVVTVVVVLIIGHDAANVLGDASVDALLRPRGAAYPLPTD